MKILPSFRSALWISAALCTVTGAVITYPSGVQSGVSGVPANASRAVPACGACHSSSAPTATRTSPPVASLIVGARILAAGQQTSVTTSVTNGVAGTTGGFLCETTRGVFVAGSGTHINGTGGSITHSNKNQRTWSYTFTAPATPGPVELTSAAMTANNSGSGGDKFSFNGFDPNSTVGTPVRIYVLPTGMTNLGNGCLDGYGNVPVLGATSAPTVGNAAFAFDVLGGATSSVALLLLGINPPGFTGIDLGPVLGITGCTGFVLSPVAIPAAPTSAGSAMRADGAAQFPFPIPNSTIYTGFAMDAQAAYFDASVAATRAIALTFTNGVHVVVQ